MSNTEPGHPTGPEVDDSQNPTTVAPADDGSAERGDASEHHADAGSPSSSRQHEMLRQVQDMIDALAREAKPVMRELAAKSAELAALAAQRAGPLAAKAAEKTQVYGERFAARSKEVAADLRRPDTAAGSEVQAAQDEPQPAEGEQSGWPQPEVDQPAPTWPADDEPAQGT